MTDRKKVIRMLNNTLRHCHNLYNHVTSKEQTWLAEINQGAKEALELLEKQEPEKVLQDRKYEIAPGVYLRKGFCPGCNQEVIWYTNKCFCGFCGQAVKWEE